MSVKLPPILQECLQGRVRDVRVLRSGPATQARLACDLRAEGASVVVVAPSQGAQRELAALVSLFSRTPESAVPGPSWDAQWFAFPEFSAGANTSRAKRRVHWTRRMACLYGLASSDGPRGAVLAAENLLPYWPPRDLLDVHHLPLAKGDECAPEMILEQAVAWGYERVGLVTRPGDVAMRGDILDIYPPGYDDPLRLEFFGDTLDEMRLFNPMSQRSKADLEETVILPVAPAVRDGSFEVEALERWGKLEKAKRFRSGLRTALGARLERGDCAMLPGLYYESPATLESWLPRDAVWLIVDPDGVESALEEAAWAWESYADPEDPDGSAVPADLLVRGSDAAVAAMAGMRTVRCEELRMGIEADGASLPERMVDSFEHLFSRAFLPTSDLDPDRADDAGAATRAAEAKDRPWQALVAALKGWSRERRQTVLAFQSVRSRTKFLHLAEQENLSFHLNYDASLKGLFALTGVAGAGLKLDKGYSLDWDGVIVLGEEVVQPRRRTAPPPSKKDFAGLKSFDDLLPGAMLVHRDYGLARFEGLKRMDLAEVANDYLILRYQGDDILYLPVDRLGLVQRYKGPEGQDPSLDRLGGAGWVRSREKARKAVEKIAHDLVEMYAYRRIAKGYGYGPTGDMFREFEASFGFEETPDQGRAIESVLTDMEKPEPMDRLVCGDVGFGKTEVAMRAAFRAALEGRQCALLCPTTVLAEQHYQNFRSRMREFPVNVGMLSRFVPKAKQKAVLEAAARGQVDILIGTHRLLSKDVHLPNLGLLILDEEQRFGVRHKERLKEMRKNIDVLTLTATPIPRTLQLSLSGMRELSVIETPPPERKAVETALVERDDGLLAHILQRELERQGQVFWVHNRVRGLDEVKRYVEKLAPGARVGMAHGQMSEKVLEETMHRFWHGELDVLVCTAIIESGLDFPKANTLVVDQAQMFGLGQLYQLRGRVGRSGQQAYAYFVVRDMDHVPDDARKRLRIVLDMDYLGAGFQVAMEDLRLRGAGNILGESQSGHVAKIGLDLFLEMLEEEVRRIRGEAPREATDPELSIAFSANIPESYMEDPADRLAFYKRLSTAGNEDEAKDVEDEIRDRFGPLPEELVHFVEVLRTKRVLGTLRAIRADLTETLVRLTWDGESDPVPPEKLVAWVQARGGRARMLPPATLELRLDAGGSLRHRLAQARTELAELIEAADNGSGNGSGAATDKAAQPGDNGDESPTGRIQ